MPFARRLQLTARVPAAYSFLVTLRSSGFPWGCQVSNSQDQKERRVVGFLGVGLDNEDGHQRLTRSEHFVLVGGSEETHERMQDTAIRFAEALRSQGKKLEETPLQEVIALFHASHG